MSKVKKLLAMLMAVVMTLGMSVTAFAAETANIVVSGLASTGTNIVTYYKILQPDVTTDSGYKIADNVTGTLSDADGNEYENAEEFLALADMGDQQSVLNNSRAYLGQGTTVPLDSDETTTFTANVGAGYYAVFITNTPSESTDPQIVYNNPMIVSIEYSKATLGADGTYTYDAISKDNSSVVAKYTTIPVEKESTDEDDVVEIGSTQGYTIETYIPSGVTSLTLVDKLQGATYIAGTVTVEIEGYPGEIDENSIVVIDPEQNTMTINLNDYVSYAGAHVTVTYNVTVTGTVVNNNVEFKAPEHTFGTDKTTLVTGAIKLTKTGVGEDLNGLPGAKFVVYKKVDSTPEIPDDELTVKYLKETITEGVKAYSWVTDIDDATKYETSDGIEPNGPKGTILIEGLDMGEYWFKEVEAPSGYSINTEDVSVEIDEDNLTSEGNVTATPDEATMADTKLSSLPSTGGIGTTIFTIGGCLIMIVAAGLFFATRRKAEK